MTHSTVSNYENISMLFLFKVNTPHWYFKMGSLNPFYFDDKELFILTPIRRTRHKYTHL